MNTKVVMNDGSLPPLDPGGFRYVMAREGMYVQRDNTLFTSCVRGRVNLPDLEPMEKSLKLRLPAVPVELLEQAVGFLRAVFKKYQGEGCLILLYNPRTKEYRWHCPVQTSDWCVKFTRPLVLPVGFIDIGDIHSHPQGIAYPSGVDTSDERSCDGLHIIAGKIQRECDQDISEKNLHFHTDFCVDGERFTLKHPFTGIPEQFPAPPDEWMANVTRAPKEKFHWGKWSGSGAASKGFDADEDFSSMGWMD